MKLTPDLKEFCALLVASEVRFLVVGGAAVIAHGFPRSTEDFDFWLARDRDNAHKVTQVVHDFGFAVVGVSADDFLVPGQVIMLGRPPNRIDLLTSISGCDFDDCFPRRQIFSFDGVQLPVIALPDLLINKRACGRHKDLGDVEEFERATDNSGKSKSC